ncbi:hypothetical protein AAA799O18_00420 [Marine Group I thaumarchaeote SCGC AAA799-O18]|jgi:cation transport ATPase|nr:hypothetical protein AAA799O18_00420 [Marine Group I thaumarchaeote SCGC AAA799-O18]
MTKWARIRKRKERRKAEVEAEEHRKAEEQPTAEVHTKDLSTQQEKISEVVQQPQKNTKHKSSQIQTSKPILSQIPRYVYLIAFFALLSGVFFPLITDDPREQNPDNVIKGTGTLFIGLVGAILVFKSTTSDKKRGILMGSGFGLIAVSLALIFSIASVPS